MLAPEPRAVAIFGSRLASAINLVTTSPTNDINIIVVAAPAAVDASSFYQLAVGS